MIDYLVFRSMVRARAQRMNMAMTPIRHDAPGGPVGGGDFGGEVQKAVCDRSGGHTQGEGTEPICVTVTVSASSALMASE